MFDHGDDEDATSPDHFGRRLFRRLRQVPDESVPISSAAAGMVKAFLVAIIVAITCAACEAFTGPSPLPPALQPDRVVRDVSGTYTLTIAAADGCGVGSGEGHLPEAARVRIYEASVQQAGAQLDITVSGPTVTYGLLLGTVEAEHVIVDLAWYDDGGGPEPSIIERLPTSGFLAVRGIVTAAGSADRVAGTLRGDLSMFATDDTRRSPIARCSSDGHQFVLTR